MSKRRTRLDLKRNHPVSAEGAERGIDGIFYVPGFVTEEEGRGLERAARSGDGGSGGGGGGGEWKDLNKRRLQIHGGTPHPSGMVEEELPAFLQEGEHQTGPKKLEEPRSIKLSLKPWDSELV